MSKVVIAGAVRTPVGSFGGALANVPAQDLGAIVIREALARAGVKPCAVDEVIMGNVLQAGSGMNVARQAAIKAGLPVETPCTTVNKVCGSGLKAVCAAAQAILANDADVIVAGGTESMSMAPYLLDRARQGYRMGDGQLVDCMIRDGLWCSLTNQHMGMTAEAVALKYGITREEQDEYAVMSQNRAEAAITSGKFREEIVSVEIPQRKSPPVSFSQDEHPRFGTNIDKVSRLRPAFKPDGTVTAANASGINDGAAAVVVASEDAVKRLGLTPLCSITSYASAGVSPELMGLGPVPATRKALDKAGISLTEIGVIEANEAFAATSIAVSRELEFDLNRVNVNGGAIALGHPIGASGARILVTLIHEMHRRSQRYGLATLCIGGGMGISMIVELI